MRAALLSCQHPTLPGIRQHVRKEKEKEKRKKKKEKRKKKKEKRKKKKEKRKKVKRKRKKWEEKKEEKRKRGLKGIPPEMGRKNFSKNKDKSERN